MKRSVRRNPAKWLLLCFPFGLYLMWRKECRYHVALKALITAAFAAVILAIVVIPSPSRDSSTSVKIVGKEKEVGIFGPEAPSGYNMDEYAVSEGGANLLAGDVVDNTIYVYASAEKGSTFYHSSDCRYAYQTRKMTLYEAYTLGYSTPCNLCHPVIYDMETGEVMENPEVTATAQAVGEIP